MNEELTNEVTVVIDINKTEYYYEKNKVQRKVQ